MKDDDITRKINIELENLQNKMKDTIREEEERGASIQDLNLQTQQLEQQTQVFEHESTRVEWKMWFKVVKWYLLVAVFVVGVLVLLFKR